MTEHKPRPLEATLNHRILIPLTLMAMMAAGCETAELGPKPVWAGGDAPTIWDAINRGLTILVRLLGIAVLIVGMWAGAKVLLEGWALYESPERIESPQQRKD